MTAAPILRFVTSNPHKAAEVEAILEIPVERVDLDLPEIQASTVEDVVRAKLSAARSSAVGGIVAIEDVALGLDDLGGFPGPYVKWLLRSAGGSGLARIASALPTRAARATCMVGLWDGAEAHFFVGEARGGILAEPRGDESFGWDAWFVPEGSSSSYGEMSRTEKSRISHRALAWRQVRAFLEE